LPAASGRVATPIPISRGLRIFHRDLQAVQATDATRLDHVNADAERYPSRVLANALVNTAWRNGRVETVHTESIHGYPFDQR